jgi:hypothetical protein
MNVIMEPITTQLPINVTRPDIGSGGRQELVGGAIGSTLAPNLGHPVIGHDGTHLGQAFLQNGGGYIGVLAPHKERASNLAARLVAAATERGRSTLGQRRHVSLMDESRRFSPRASGDAAYHVTGRVQQVKIGLLSIILKSFLAQEGSARANFEHLGKGLGRNVLLGVRHGSYTSK